MAKKLKTNQTIEQILSDNTGKLPPQSLDLEEAVLGAVMIDKDACNTVIDILKPECFYSEAHRKIYEVILDLYKNMRPIDMLTVKDELSQRKALAEIGGPAYIAKLTTRVASSAHAEYHARIIVQKYIQRELIRISNEIQRKSYNDEEDVDDLLDESQNALFNLSYGSVRREAQPIDAVIHEAIEQIKEASKREDKLSGVPSGFVSLDRVTSGWQRSDLVIIAARPSMGKTAFVLSMARNIAVEHKYPVAFFSLEMSSVQLVNRIISAETEIDSHKIRTGQLTSDEWIRLENKIKNLEEAKIFIDDTPAISISALRAKARRLVAQHDVKIIIIDYLQLMTGNTNDKSQGNREQEVSAISRSLKALAKDLKVPIIALSQLNRSIETRSGSKRPQLSDLRESGAIEQDADLVIFIHRPEKYGLDEENGMPTKGLAQIIIAKHRNGAVTDVSLRFIESYAKFTDYDEFDSSNVNVASGESVTFPSKMNNNTSVNPNDLPPNRSFDNNDNVPY
jgi:replicative DNA helicase